MYIGRTLGSLAGLLAGWSMIAAYAGCMLACVFAAHVFVADLLKGIGLAAVTPPGWLFDLAFVGLIWLFAHRDIRLSSRVSLVLEALSLVIIGSITAMIMARRGHIVDPVQLHLPSLGFAGVTSALACAVFSFVSFESAATLLSIALICLGLAGFAPIDAFGYTGTFATFGFLVVYLLISIVAPLDLSRAGIMRARHLAVGVIGVLLMLFVFFGSLYPVPDYPYNLLPYLFAFY